MTRAERRREAAEGRLRVLLYGCTPLFAAVARAVRLAQRPLALQLERLGVQ